MAITIYNRKWFVLLTTAAITIILVMSISTNNIYQQTVHSVMLKKRLKENNWRKFSEEQIKSLSVLGRILYLDEEPPKRHDVNKTYKILMWKYGQFSDKRHMRGPNNEKIDPFKGCSVNNCQVTYDDNDIDNADLVIFHLHRIKRNETLPKRRSYDQIWAFLSDESPYHTFLSGNKLSSFNGIFNWSMTYRMDSDIPVPYGRTVLRRSTDSLDPEPWREKRKDVLVAILGSNCVTKNHRWEYVKELQKYVKVDVYGKCGTINTCPGHFRKDCNDIGQYLFYLAFENSNCDQYITEKLWWNAYMKKSIPIVMGASKKSYQQLLPPESYLNVEDYAKPKDLAAHILYLSKTERYKDFYKWRSEFEILNEHGYFQTKSYHYCRACEALNYNKRSIKIYNDLDTFWGVKKDCHPAWDA